MKKWLSLVKLLAPIILTTVKPELGPIAGEITEAINEAEQIKGANGPEKLQHVKNIANNAANAINTAKNKEVVDKATLNKAIEDGVNTVVAVTNLIQKKSDEVK